MTYSSETLLEMLAWWQSTHLSKTLVLILCKAN
jgi:hypothetical protein